ncbi:MAG: hypothetical protein IKV97_05400 [Clostridia bacterium]|nr:hypothetical protein [Clostridia bacterium]
MRRRDKSFASLITQLYLSNNSFELGDERSIELFGQVKNSSFAIGQMEYDTVVLPNLITVQSTTAKILKEFMSCGGRVIVLGSSPTMLDGKEDINGALHFLDSAETASSSDILLSILPKSDYRFNCEYDDRSVFIRKSDDENESFFFLFNSDCSDSRPGVLTVNGTVNAEIWDGFERSRTPVFCEYSEGNTRIPLTIPCGGSIMLHTKRSESSENSVAPLQHTETKLALNNRWETERENKNVLLLEFCRYKKGDGEYSHEYPVLGIHEKLTAENYHGTLTQKFVFSSEECFGGLSLALEDAQMHSIRFNGQEIPTEVTGYYLAKAFEIVDLPKCQKGQNVIELTCEYAPLEKMKSSIGSLFQTRKGVELESIYLLGDFAVKTVQEPERGGNLRYSRNMSIANEPRVAYGELTRAGYPFYAGTIKLSQKFECPKALCDGEKVFFSLDELDASHCHISVNGIPCGCIHTPPYRSDITNALKNGENILEIQLVNTLRNLLGPYHRPFGEIGNHFGGGYKYPDAAWAAASPEWYENRIPDTAEWTDSYMLNRLGVKGAAIICCSDKSYH